MIRTLIRRTLGSKFGSHWSMRLQKTLLWPTWAVFEMGDTIDKDIVQNLTSLMRKHNQLGVFDFILSGSNLYFSSEILQVVQRCWYEGYRIWLVSKALPNYSDSLIQLARSGASGIALLVSSQDDLKQINLFIEACHACPETKFRIVISPDFENLSTLQTLIEIVSKHGVAFDIDLQPSEDTYITSIIDSTGIIKEQIQFSDFERNWPLLVNRGCSCIEPFSGWYIDRSFHARLCNARESLGDITKAGVRQLWLSTKALQHQETTCSQTLHYSNEVWRKPEAKFHPLLVSKPLSTVSVVVPSYGRPANRIVKTLNALLQQDYDKDKYTIILVDDGDPTMFAKQAVEMCEEPTRIKYIRAPHGGAASARNYGIREATGDIIAFTDDDCEPTRNWLRELVLSFADGNIGGVGGLTLPIDSNNLIVRFLDQRRALRRFLTDKDLEKPDILPTANAAYLRSSLEAIGGFSEAFARVGLPYGGEDRYLTWRVIQEGYDIKINLNARVFHHHRNSLWQMIEQGYQYGRGCYLHCRLSGLPFDYEPRLITLVEVFLEYLWPYSYWVGRYYRKGANLGDAFIFPFLDFLRRAASAWGSYITHRQLQNQNVLDLQIKS